VSLSAALSGEALAFVARETGLMLERTLPETTVPERTLPQTTLP
jgi:hypothetical protein